MITLMNTHINYSSTHTRVEVGACKGYFPTTIYYRDKIKTVLRLRARGSEEARDMAGTTHLARPRG